VRLAVLSHDAGAVDQKPDREVHDPDIMYELVDRPLEECGIYRYEGLEPAFRQRSGEGYGMLLGYADIEEPFRRLVLELEQARAELHRRGNRHDVPVLPGKVRQRFAGDLGIGERGAGLLYAGGQVERTDAVEARRVHLRGQVTLPLFRQHVDHLGPVVYLFYPLKDSDELGHVMTVNGPEVEDAHVLEELAGNDHLFEAVEKTGYEIEEKVSDPGHPLDQGHRRAADAVVHGARDDPREVFRHRTHVLRD